MQKTHSIQKTARSSTWPELVQDSRFQTDYPVPGEPVILPWLSTAPVSPAESARIAEEIGRLRAAALRERGLIKSDFWEICSFSILAVAAFCALVLCSLPEPKLSRTEATPSIRVRTPIRIVTAPEKVVGSVP